MKIEHIGEYITRTTIPFKDIFTTVYTVKTEEGFLLFDTASYECDVDDVILPTLKELGITEDNLKYIFISHRHGDHAGGLRRLLTYFPKTTVLSRSASLAQETPEGIFHSPEEGEKILGHLSVVTIVGHTRDAAAIYDERTKMLITGDCLQLFGIFGSGEWGANISFPAEHLAEIEKLGKMEIESIYTAHDYHPYGYAYIGREAVENALDASARPLLTMKKMIENHPDCNDDMISDLYHASAKLPTVATRVFAAVRRELLEAKA